MLNAFIVRIKQLTSVIEPIGRLKNELVKQTFGCPLNRHVKILSHPPPRS